MNMDRRRGEGAALARQIIQRTAHRANNPRLRPGMIAARRDLQILGKGWMVPQPGDIVRLNESIGVAVRWPTEQDIKDKIATAGDLYCFFPSQLCGGETGGGGVSGGWPLEKLRVIIRNVDQHRELDDETKVGEPAAE